MGIAAVQRCSRLENKYKPNDMKQNIERPARHSSNTLVSGWLVNWNELIIPINFTAIAEEHGVRKGNIFYSPTWNSWVLSGHPDIDLICIDAPFKQGQIVNGLVGNAGRFNGKEVKSVVIKSNMWSVSF